MAGGYSSKAVANYLLDKFLEQGAECTQLQINKLVYIAHGWHLALSPATNGLIDEDVIAWKFGPVIPTLREQFRDYGSDPITEHATTWVDVDEEYVPTIAQADPAGWEINLLDWVWRAYGAMTGAQLIELTHLPDSPWAQITKNGTDIGHNKKIPRDLIREYYRKLKDQTLSEISGRS